MFWKEVLGVIAEVTSVTLERKLGICLLGLVENIIPMVVKRTQIGLLLFYARKANTLSLKKKTAPPHWPFGSI